MLKTIARMLKFFAALFMLERSI